MAKKSGSAGRKFLVILFLALVVALAILLYKCGPGGLGLGPGAGGTASGEKGSASAPASASAPPSASVSATTQVEAFVIRVAGTTCKIGKDDQSKECPEACTAADEATKGKPKREVRLSPSKGSQEVVETLKKCLTDKGMVILEVDD